MGKTYSIITRSLVCLIRSYQYLMAPLLGQRCRFYPSCSSYAIDAIHQYGFLHGGFLSIKRLLRCNPLCKGGFDPVKTNSQKRG